MESNLFLLKTLVTTLNIEIDSMSNNLSSNRNISFNLSEKMRELESNLIKAALLGTRGNQRQAAKLLGLTPSTLFNKIKSHNLDQYLKELNL